MRLPTPRGVLRELRERRRRRQELALLPAAVARFHARARSEAARAGDRFSLASATAPRDVARIVELAGGAREVVEIGTGTAWTSISLALAEPERRVVSFDPIEWEHRHRYLALVDPSVRERIELVEGFGEPAAEGFGRPVEFLFLDSSHEREETVATFRAWEPRIAPGARVVFHDYGHPEYPGVAEAIEELGLDGEPEGPLYVWRKPAG